MGGNKGHQGLGKGKRRSAEGATPALLLPGANSKSGACLGACASVPRCDVIGPSLQAASMYMKRRIDHKDSHLCGKEHIAFSEELLVRRSKAVRDLSAKRLPGYASFATIKLIFKPSVVTET